MTEALLDAAPELTDAQVDEFHDVFAAYLHLIENYNGDQSAVVTKFYSRTGTKAYFSKAVPFPPEVRAKFKEIILSQAEDETNERIDAIIKNAEKITSLWIKYLKPHELAFMAPATNKILTDYKIDLHNADLNLRSFSTFDDR